MFVLQRQKKSRTVMFSERMVTTINFRMWQRGRLLDRAAPLVWRDFFA